MNRDGYDSVYDARTVVDILKKAGYQRSPNAKGEEYVGTAPININNFILNVYENKLFYIKDKYLYVIMYKDNIEIFVGSIWYSDIIIFEATVRKVEMR